MTRSLTLVGGRDRELPAHLDRPAAAGAVRGGVVLAHGAGGTSRTPFIERAAAGLVRAGWAVLRFDFGYAAVGGRPSRADRADAPEWLDYRAALTALAEALPAGSPLIAAGKSYGGRIATFLVASGRTAREQTGEEDGQKAGQEAGQEAGRDAFHTLLARVGGVLVFGYPIGGPGRDRPADVAALRTLGRPLLVVQGSRDALGPVAALEAAIEGVTTARIAVIKGGDHSYRAAGGPQIVKRLEDAAIAAAVEWLERLGTASVDSLALGV